MNYCDIQIINNSNIYSLQDLKEIVNVNENNTEFDKGNETTKVDANSEIIAKKT